MTHHVLVLGGSGQLGAAVAGFLSEREGFAVRATARNTALIPHLRTLAPRAEWQAFDALCAGLDASLEQVMAGQEWVVNAIGVIKQRIDHTEPESVARAMRVDLELPVALGRAAPRHNSRVLQIATDCVFSGATGGYTENAPHDAHDAYGRNKSRGEVGAGRLHHLRCSVVGLEAGPPVSLLGWFLSQPPGANVRGFINHRWNGLSTLHFASLVAAVIENDVTLGHLQHIVPCDLMTKHDLLHLFARTFGREDIVIKPFETAIPVDRSLATNYPEANAGLWALAGYSTPPTIEHMVREFEIWSRTAYSAGRTS